MSFRSSWIFLFLVLLAQVVEGGEGASDLVRRFLPFDVHYERDLSEILPGPVKKIGLDRETGPLPRIFVFSTKEDFEVVIAKVPVAFEDRADEEREKWQKVRESTRRFNERRKEAARGKKEPSGLLQEPPLPPHDLKKVMATTEDGVRIVVMNYYLDQTANHWVSQTRIIFQMAVADKVSPPEPVVDKPTPPRPGKEGKGKLW